MLDVAGEAVAALPTPEQLLEVTSFPGIPDVKLRRMHGVAAAALAGELDTETLRMRDVDEVGVALRRLEGIGPFYAELVTVRALGHTDVLPTTEPRVVAATAHRLGREQLERHRLRRGGARPGGRGAPGPASPSAPRPDAVSRLEPAPTTAPRPSRRRG